MRVRSARSQLASAMGGHGRNYRSNSNNSSNNRGGGGYGQQRANSGGQQRQLCTFWPQGKCRNGNNCAFEHAGPGGGTGGGNGGGGGGGGGHGGAMNNSFNLLNSSSTNGFFSPAPAGGGGGGLFNQSPAGGLLNLGGQPPQQSQSLGGNLFANVGGNSLFGQQAQQQAPSMPLFQSQSMAQQPGLFNQPAQPLQQFQSGGLLQMGGQQPGLQPQGFMQQQPQQQAPQPLFGQTSTVGLGFNQPQPQGGLFAPQQHQQQQPQQGGGLFQQQPQQGGLFQQQPQQQQQQGFPQQQGVGGFPQQQQQAQQGALGFPPQNQQPAAGLFGPPTPQQPPRQDLFASQAPLAAPSVVAPVVAAAVSIPPPDLKAAVSGLACGHKTLENCLLTSDEDLAAVTYWPWTTYTHAPSLESCVKGDVSFEEMRAVFYQARKVGGEACAAVQTHFDQLADDIKRQRAMVLADPRRMHGKKFEAVLAGAPAAVPAPSAAAPPAGAAPAAASAVAAPVAAAVAVGVAALSAAQIEAIWRAPAFQFGYIPECPPPDGLG